MRYQLLLNGKRWRVITLVALIVSWLGVGGGARVHAVDQSAAPTVAVEAPDPAEPGPFAVGATRRTFTRPSTTTGQPRELATIIWYPVAPEAAAGATRDAKLAALTDVAPARVGGPWPIVLFSHGSGGVPWQSTFLTTQLASLGFVVVAPAHTGNTAFDCRDGCLAFDAESRAKLLDSAQNRPDDIIFTFDQALALSRDGDTILGGLIDGERAGVAGHSFGGFTALAVAARDNRFKAAAPMAPAIPGSQNHARRLATPIMFFGAALDHLAPLKGVESLYQAVPTPGPERWLVAFPRGGHFAYADWCPAAASGCAPTDLPLVEAHRLVNRWVGAFFLAQVAGDARFRAWLEPALAADSPNINVAYDPGE